MIRFLMEDNERDIPWRIRDIWWTDEIPIKGVVCKFCATPYTMSWWFQRMKHWSSADLSIFKRLLSYTPTKRTYLLIKNLLYVKEYNMYMPGSCCGGLVGMVCDYAVGIVRIYPVYSGLSKEYTCTPRYVTPLGIHKALPEQWCVQPYVASYTILHCVYHTESVYTTPVEISDTLIQDTDYKWEFPMYTVPLDIELELIKREYELCKTYQLMYKDRVIGEWRRGDMYPQ